MNARPFSSLVHSARGRVGVAMGGGPSLPLDMARAPLGALLVSANEHGAKFEQVDYIVGVDRHVYREKNLAKFGVPILAPHGWADFRIAKQHHASSGITAAWALWVMGCAPILLAGMDLFRGATYFDDPTAPSSGKTVKLGKHIDRWLGLKRACGGIHSPFRALSGPLLDFFPAYDSTERVAASPLAAAVVSATGVRIVFQKPYEGKNEDRFEPGDVPELAPETADRFIRGGYARAA